MYFKTLQKEECSGCSACCMICPKHCISMKMDNEGFYYPEIDKTSCINCKQCEQICPFDRPQYNNSNNPEVYATYLINEQQRKKSSSGGLFYAISQWIIENGGIVYGAAFDSNFRLRHIGVERVEELHALRGSKYVQSYMGSIFREIKLNLESGKWVFFTGVGCQVAGLKSYLKKSYDKLITSDLVCHGAPSQLMLDWHLQYLSNKEHGKIKEYYFRDNDGWEVCEQYRFVTKDGKEKTKKLYSYSLSPYLFSFMQGYTYRYSCYNCKFARIPRQGDLTLGDFWGANKFFHDIDTKSGVSLVLVNSEKGKYIWEQIAPNVICRKSTVSAAAECNANLIKASEKTEVRKYCYDLIRKKGYSYVAKTIFKAPHYNRIKIKTFLAHTKLWKKLKTIAQLSTNN